MDPINLTAGNCKEELKQSYFIPLEIMIWLMKIFLMTSKGFTSPSFLSAPARAGESEKEATLLIQEAVLSQG